MNPISHACDPETSGIAAASMEASGRRQANKILVADLCRRFPGSTAIELWEHATRIEKSVLKEPQEVRRRLTDLLSDGLVIQSVARKCYVRRTKMVTWMPASHAPRTTARGVPEPVRRPLGAMPCSSPATAVRSTALRAEW